MCTVKSFVREESGKTLLVLRAVSHLYMSPMVETILPAPANSAPSRQSESAPSSLPSLYECGAFLFHRSLSAMKPVWLIPRGAKKRERRYSSNVIPEAFSITPASNVYPGFEYENFEPGVKSGCNCINSCIFSSRGFCSMRLDLLK